jgi:hypothetical protein
MLSFIVYFRIQLLFQKSVLLNQNVPLPSLLERLDVVGKKNVSHFASSLGVRFGRRIGVHNNKVPYWQGRREEDARNRKNQARSKREIQNPANKEMNAKQNNGDLGCVVGACIFQE